MTNKFKPKYFLIYNNKEQHKFNSIKEVSEFWNIDVNFVNTIIKHNLTYDGFQILVLNKNNDLVPHKLKEDGK